MKKLYLPLLAETVAFRRKEKKMTQARLAALTGMNRSLLSRLEAGSYTPSVDQLQALSEALEFDTASLFLSPELFPDGLGVSLFLAETSREKSKKLRRRGGRPVDKENGSCYNERGKRNSCC